MAVAPAATAAPPDTARRRAAMVEGHTAAKVGAVAGRLLPPCPHAERAPVHVGAAAAELQLQRLALARTTPSSPLRELPAFRISRGCANRMGSQRRCCCKRWCQLCLAGGWRRRCRVGRREGPWRCRLARSVHGYSVVAACTTGHKRWCRPGCHGCCSHHRVCSQPPGARRSKRCSWMRRWCSLAVPPPFGLPLPPRAAAECRSPAALPPAPPCTPTPPCLISAVPGAAWSDGGARPARAAQGGGPAPAPRAAGASQGPAWIAGGLREALGGLGPTARPAHRPSRPSRRRRRPSARPWATGSSAQTGSATCRARPGASPLSPPLARLCRRSPPLARRLC